MPDISLACKAEEGGDAVASSTDDNAADKEIDGILCHKLQVVSTPVAQQRESTTCRAVLRMFEEGF